MKKHWWLFVLLGFVSNAQSTLVDIGDGQVSDSTTGKIWLYDWTSTPLNYFSALIWAAGLTNGGVSPSTWQIPYLADYNSLWRDAGGTYSGLQSSFNLVPGQPYSTSRDFTPPFTLLFGPLDASTTHNHQFERNWVTAVRDGAPPTIIPPPPPPGPIVSWGGVSSTGQSTLFSATQSGTLRNLQFGDTVNVGDTLNFAGSGGQIDQTIGGVGQMLQFGTVNTGASSASLVLSDPVTTGKLFSLLSGAVRLTKKGGEQVVFDVPAGYAIGDIDVIASSSTENGISTSSLQLLDGTVTFTDVTGDDYFIPAGFTFTEAIDLSTDSVISVSLVPSAVPELSSLVMLVSGLLGLALGRGKRLKNGGTPCAV